MNSKKNRQLRALLITGAAALMIPCGAFAAMTKPCTQISNTATLAYTVGGVGQGDVTSPSNSGNQFLVGAKIIVTVSDLVTSYVSLTPSSTASPAVLKFQVKNDSNTNLNFALASQAFNNTADPYGGTDSFDVSSPIIRVENGSTAGYQPAQDTATSISNLASDGGTATVYIAYTPTDLTAANNAIAAYYLKATAQWLDGSAIAAPTSGNATQTVNSAMAPTCSAGGQSIDIVYGDLAGGATGDGSRDGVHSAAGAYKVASANIAVTKSYTVVSDPINGTSNQKAIPGAVVRYSIAIANTGGSSALLSTITDQLQSNLGIVTGSSATWAVPASSRATKSGNLTPDAADANADGLAFDSGTNTATATITSILKADAGNGYAAGELKAGETLTLTLDATIQ